MAVSLTKGVIRDIHNGKSPDTLTVQVLAARKFPNGDRCRLLISDGLHSSGFAILASQLSHLVSSGEVGENTVVEVTRYFCNDVQGNKKMMIILDMNVVMPGADVGKVIGAPTSYDKVAQTGGGCGSSSTSTSDTGNSSAKPPAQRAPPPGRSPLVQRNVPNKGISATTAASPKTPQGMPNVRKIATLTPYQNKWTICARVTMKSNIRTWSKSTGEGKLFSMNLLDESGEIRATAFNQECDRFYDLVEVNKVYFITSANLKTANKQYSNLNNDYEMTFNQGTQMEPCNEESDIPAMVYDFVSLDKLEGLQKDSIIDLVAVCKEANELSTVTMRSTGRELTKRDITIVDDSNRSVSLTLWGTDAEKFDGSSNPVIAIKGAKVSDYYGVSLSALSSSTITINPDLGEAHQLKGWWEQGGSSDSSIVSLTTSKGSGQGVGANNPIKTFEEVKREGLGSKDQPDYFTTKATVLLVRKENLLYMACPGDSCNKKVTDMSNGMYRCEKCNKEYDRFNWRLMVQANLGDYTGNQWVTLFQDAAEIMLDSKADDIAALRDENPDMFQEHIHKRSFTEFLFRCRIKMETYNDERRLKTSVMSIHPMNYKEYNRRLINDIKAMSA